jgi:hypothetical protein
MKRSTPMKRGAPLKSKTPMARTGMLRTASVKKAAPAPRASLKSKGPKMTPIRRAARGEECTLRIPGVCNRDPATTVLCHSNRLADGKGMGLKAPDSAACFACHACHDVLDGRRPLPANLTREQLNAGFDAAVVRTHARLREKGIEVCNP